MDRTQPSGGCDGSSNLPRGAEKILARPVYAPLANGKRYMGLGFEVGTQIYLFAKH